MPLRVRNCEPNMTVFAKSVDGNIVNVRWGPKGTGDDTMRVPDSLVEDIDFLASLESGTLEVVDAPESIREKVTFETNQFRADRIASELRQAEVLDRRQERDILGNTCVGPAPAGRTGACNRQVLQSAKAAKEQPPLCRDHAHLAERYFLVENGGKGEADEAEMSLAWKPVRVG